MSTQLKEGQEVMRPELTELTKTGASGEAVGGDRMLTGRMTKSVDVTVDR